MACAFHILIDIADRRLADFAVCTALSLETSGRLVAVEAHPPLHALCQAPWPGFSVMVFDRVSRGPSELAELCRSFEMPNAGQPIVSIHVGDDCFLPMPARVVGMSEEFFKESFLQVLAFCYITQQVRAAVSDARKLL